MSASTFKENQPASPYEAMVQSLSRDNKKLRDVLNAAINPHADGCPRAKFRDRACTCGASMHLQ